MKFSLITLFPAMFYSYLQEGVIARALKAKLIEIEIIPLRDFAQDKRKTVDDVPAGGGDGMVIRADITEKALQAVINPDAKIILTTPRAKLFNNVTANNLAKQKHLIILCGRYAGFDERFIDRYQPLQLSLGDFVLSGGELAAMCMIDAISRFIPGILGNAVSAQCDSFNDGLLEAPCYTKPEFFHGAPIPAVLRSGNHAEIEKYKRIEQIKVTAKYRPDLINLLWDTFSKKEKAFIQKIWQQG